MASTSVQSIVPAPRTSTACESCRTRKLRCIPSDTSAGCQRCLEERTTCIASVPKPRRVHNRSVPSAAPRKTFQLEPGDDVLVEALRSVGKPKNHDQEGLGLKDFHRSMLDTHFPDTDSALSDSTLTSKARLRRLSLSKPSGPQPKIDAKVAVSLLGRYEKLGHYFPFVRLPQGWTLPSILKERPFLALGIFAAMSNTAPDLQRRLDINFRKALSDQVTVNGARSLDILQGLLVYIAWFPMNLYLRTSQAFHLLHIAATMISDLGYDDLRTLLDPTADKAYVPEAKLAVLGCYYVASAYYMPPKRANEFPFASYMEYYLLQIQQTRRSDLDDLSIHLFKLARIVEGLVNDDGMPNWRLADPYAVQLQQVFDSAPAQLSQYPSYFLFRQFASMRLSLALAYTHQPPSPEQAVISTRTMFETLTSLDMVTYLDFSLEWGHIIRSSINVFILLSTALNQPTDESTIQQLSQFGTYFESLCFRMRELSRSKNDNTSTPDIFMLFDSVLGVVRQKYNKMVAMVQKAPNAPLGHRGFSTSMASLCPVLNGGIKNTEYWAMFSNAPSSSGEGSVGDQSSLTQFPDLNDLTSWSVMDNQDNSFYLGLDANLSEISYS